MKLADSAMQCSGCRTYFSGIKSFDAHRSGHVNNRKCANPEALGMRIIGLVLGSKVWRLPVS